MIRRSRFVVGLGLILLSSTIAPLVTTAQAPTPEQAVPEAAPETPPQETVAASGIVRRAEQAVSRVRSIEPEVESDERIQGIEREFDATIEGLRARMQEIEQTDLAELAIRELGDLRAGLLPHQQMMDSWESRLGERSSELQGYRDELDESLALWERTAESLLATDQAEALVLRVDTVLELSRELRSRVTGRQELVLALQDRVSQERLEVDELLRRIDDSRRSAASRLWTIQDEPLWTTFGDSEQQVPLRKQLAELLRGEVKTLRAFVASNASALVVHATCVVFGVLLLLALRHWSRDRLASEEYRSTAQVLSRPFSLAFLASGLLRPLLYPEPPAVVVDLLRMLWVIPMLRLLPGMIQPALRRPLYILSALFLLDVIRDLTPTQSLLHRYLLLGITLLALAAFAAALGPYGRLGRGREPRSTPRFVVTASWLVLVALAVSLVANVLGATVLATLLTDGTLTAAYVGVLILTIVVVLSGLWRLVLLTPAAQSLRSVRLHPTLIHARGVTGLRLGGLLLWLWVTAGIFEVREVARQAALSLLDRPLPIPKVQITPGDILAFVLTLWVASLVSRFVRFVLEEDALPRVTLPRGVPQAISSITHYTILAVGFLLAVAAGGFDLGRLTLLAGAFGVGIGFGLQNVVNNFVSGLILMFERPVQLGDTVELGTLLGKVRRIGIRSSTVETFEGAEVIVPNGDLIANSVVNWTLSNRRRRCEVRVGVAYGTNVRRVSQLLVEVALGHEKVLKDPEPYVLFAGFGESSLEFKLRFWTADFDAWIFTDSEVATRVSEALEEAGIRVPFPQRDLHVRSVDREAGRSLAADRGDSPADERTGPANPDVSG